MANKYAGTKTEKNLWEAFAGESQARNKYTYFASVAKKAGYEQIAALFLKTALNAKRHYLNEPPLDAVQFMKRLKTRAQALGITDEMLKRPVNVGFSGGEKKRMETFQMAFLEPDFCILDEMDSGLDIDALRIVSDGINVLREPHRSFLMITHFHRLLNYVTPDYIHIMVNGRIVKSGDKTLALHLEENGYEEFK